MSSLVSKVISWTENFVQAEFKRQKGIIAKQTQDVERDYIVFFKLNEEPHAQARSSRVR
jgi:hypothetical protein